MVPAPAPTAPPPDVVTVRRQQREAAWTGAARPARHRLSRPRPCTPHRCEAQGPGKRRCDWCWQAAAPPPAPRPHDGPAAMVATDTLGPVRPLHRPHRAVLASGIKGLHGICWHLWCSSCCQLHARAHRDFRGTVVLSVPPHARIRRLLWRQAPESARPDADDRRTFSRHCRRKIYLSLIHI